MSLVVRLCRVVCLCGVHVLFVALHVQIIYTHGVLHSNFPFPSLDVGPCLNFKIDGVSSTKKGRCDGSDLDVWWF